MAKRRIIEDRPRAFQPLTTTAPAAAMVDPKELNKETHSQVMAREMAPEPVKEPERITFYGVGSIAFDVVDEKAKTKKIYDVDFGQLFRYSTTNPVVIALLREKGYKEKGK